MIPMTQNACSRIGFHYFPDTLHYRQHDLETWLPELTAMGAAWITLLAPSQRAIPEEFIRGLLDSRIEPLLQFHLPIDRTIRQVELSILLENYARWGVRYITLFDRPNLRISWPDTAWTQTDLVESFLDIYLPLAELSKAHGLRPVFPPLEPGGDYWDTAFLQSALAGIRRRGHHALLDVLVLGAYAWTYNRPLDWGAGGPDRWPASTPYHTPDGSQDQIGLWIFDWYQAVAEAELGKRLPLIVLRGGSRLNDLVSEEQAADALKMHAQENMHIIERLVSAAEPSEGMSHSNESYDLSMMIPPEVVAFNFWLLTCADANTAKSTSACCWYQPDGNPLPVVNALKQWTTLGRKAISQDNRLELGTFQEDLAFTSQAVVSDEFIRSQPIDHYLLMPLYAWGAADWDLEAIQPFILEHHPTVGFSIQEACLASRVTIVGGASRLPEDTLDLLKAAGCQLEQMNQDGTLLAI